MSGDNAAAAKAQAELSVRAELLACLAQAMRAPRDEAFVKALQELLPEDLAELSEALGLETMKELASLREALGVLADHTALLGAYSTLFLSPPPRLRLNLVRLMDGGASTAGLRYLDDLLARHELGVRADQKDMPDHITVMLETAACLAERAERGDPRAEHDAAVLVRQVLAPAVKLLADKAGGIEVEHGLAPVYSRLLGLIAAVCEDRGEQLFAGSSGRSDRANEGDTAIEEPERVMARCEGCGTAFLSLREQELLIDRLQQAGMPSDYLRRCQPCRDASRGLGCATAGCGSRPPG